MQIPEQHYTPDEYWILAETFPLHKYEYINGYVRMMSGGSPAHGQISTRIGGILDRALMSSECNVYSSDVRVQLTGQRIYLPDVSVSCDPADWTQKKAIASPTLVVEVLSPSTENTDKTEKLDAYRQYPTIQNILLVNARRRYVDHYHRLGPINKWEVSTYERDTDVIMLASIDVSFTLRDIYFKVYLELEERTDREDRE